jgi:tetratricopeptide (TPR) repeat protein
MAGVALLAALAALAGTAEPASAREPTVVATDRTDDVDRLVRNADHALATGRPAEAAALYDKALRLDPSAAVIQYGRGRALEAMGLRAEAAAAYQSALRLDPDHPGAVVGLAGLVAEEEPEVGLADLRRLRAGRPGDPWLAVRIGRLEAQRGQWEAAAAEFEMAATALPDHAAVAHNLAVARDRLGDVPAAIAGYEQVLSLPPTTGVPLTQVRARLAALRGGTGGAAAGPAEAPGTAPAGALTGAPATGQ